MITVRRAKDRGHSKIGWLDSWHTFSFSDYYDPEHMGFRALRVINDDTVKGGAGFPPHGHRDMEIISYVLEGGLEHKDSLGTGSVIRPGDVQRMSAGTGVTHSEFNHSKTEPVHFLQIWIIPESRGIKAGYEQKRFEDLDGKLRLVAAPGGPAVLAGALTLHQDASLYVAKLAAGDSVSHTLAPGRHAWVQVARGEVTLGDEKLGTGDGAAVSDATKLDLRASAAAEILLFDLA